MNITGALTHDKLTDEKKYKKISDFLLNNMILRHIGALNYIQSITLLTPPKFLKLKIESLGTAADAGVETLLFLYMFKLNLLSIQADDLKLKQDPFSLMCCAANKFPFTVSVTNLIRTLFLLNLRD